MNEIVLSFEEASTP